MKKLKITSLICAMTLGLMSFASTEEALIGCRNIQDRDQCIECCDFAYSTCVRSSTNSEQYCSDIRFF